MALIDEESGSLLDFLNDPLSKLLMRMVDSSCGGLNVAISTYLPKFPPQLHLASIMMDSGRDSNIFDEVLECIRALLL